MPLTAGTIGGPVTSTKVPLIGTVASGGGGPISYQWHYSLTSGFTPGPGTEIGGATGLTLVHCSRTPSTTYYYRLAYTDGNQTAYSSELSVTTLAGGGSIVILANPGYDIGTYTDLADAVATLGSDQGTLLVASPQTVTADLVVPVNVTLQFEGNGVISVDTGITLTVNGPIQAAPIQLFSGLGTVLLGNRFLTVAWVEWFGAVADGNQGSAAFGIDNTPAINRAIYSVPASSGTIDICFAGHAYKVAGSINIINNAANRNRRNLRLLGKNEGRRNNDVNSGTILVWAGNGIDPLIDLRSRNCTIENFQVTIPPGHTLSAAVLSDDIGGLSQIITANYFKNFYVNPDGGGSYTDGVRMGSSGADNQEHHRFEGCAFTGAQNSGVFADNGTGQMKYLQFEDCTFNSCRYGWLAQVASADFTRCNFTGITETAMRWSGGAYEPCTMTDCDNEATVQMVYGGGVDLSIINCRLSCENGTPSPTPGQEYIYGTNNLTIIGTQIQNGETNFKIRPVDGGSVTAISVQFPNVTFMPLDNSISWIASFTGCQNPSLSIYIPDGIRRTSNFLIPNGSMASLTEWAGRQRISNQGVVDSLTSLPVDAFDYWWDTDTHYARISQGGAYPNQFATVQPYGDTRGTTATFSNASGSVAANTYHYAYTIVTASGESTEILFVSSVTNVATGTWTLTNVPFGPAGCTSRNIYRKPSVSGAYAKVGTIANNTGTTFVDAQAAGSGAPPVSDTSGLATSLTLGTLTPTAVVMAPPGALGTPSYLVVNVAGVLWGLACKQM